ncbi:hypothetical protein NC651_014801 [Populus alba x Populus x berolinensis]|nr:hypothetical protein NC651_014801 [Populus alba x Populus x berolinensis]
MAWFGSLLMPFGAEGYSAIGPHFVCAPSENRRVKSNSGQWPGGPKHVSPQSGPPTSAMEVQIHLCY